MGHGLIPVAYLLLGVTFNPAHGCIVGHVQWVYGEMNVGVHVAMGVRRHKRQHYLGLGGTIERSQDILT
jgi:hypothetical protein